MKTTISSLLLVLLVGCSSVPQKQKDTSNHEQAIGSITLTYNGSGEWVKLSSVGTAPINDQSPHAISEASKVAALHAKQNIAEFMSDSLKGTKVVDTHSKSNVNSKGDDSDNDQNTITEVMEHIKSESSAILKGVHVTNQTVSDRYVQVNVEVTKQTIDVSKSIQSYMNGVK